MRVFLAGVITLCVCLSCDEWFFEEKPGEWEYFNDFPGNGREKAVSFTIENKVYIGLGRAPIMNGHYDNSDSVYFSDFWCFNSLTNEWEMLSNFPQGAAPDALGFSIRNKGFVIISEDTRNTLWEYNPFNDHWQKISDFPGFSRNRAVSFAINNKGYFGLGIANDTIKKESIGATDLWEYDPDTNSWTRKADFPGPPREEAVSFTINNKAFICTGSPVQTGLLSTLRDVWEFNPVNDTWTQRTDFGGYPRWKATAFSIDQKGYLGTGEVTLKPGLSNPASDFWEYDYETDKWQQIDNYPVHPLNALAFVIQNSCFMGLGYESWGQYSTSIYKLKITN